MITEELRKLYQSYTGSPAEEITELPSSGSNRRYFRIKGPETLIGVSGTSIEENEAFIYMAKHFRGKGLPVPQVYASSDDHSFYIQEDLEIRFLSTPSRKAVKAVYSTRRNAVYYTRRSPNSPTSSSWGPTVSISRIAIRKPSSTNGLSFGT